MTKRVTTPPILSCAEETALVDKDKREDWYYHSRDTLTPTLTARN